MHAFDPNDLQTINDFVQSNPNDRKPLVPPRIQRIHSATNADGILHEQIKAAAGGGRVLVVIDHTTIIRDDEPIKPVLVDAISRYADPLVHALPPGHDGEFHATLTAAEVLKQTINDASPPIGAMVSIGSGSVTDVAKYARHLHKNETGSTIPFICFPTAASVTAYTSALAVLSVSGVKRTLPSLPPDIVICDLATLAGAPARMTCAGFGDVLARSVSYGDWFLANELGMDDGFSLVPGRLLEGAESNMLACAGEVAARTEKGVQAVLDAVLLSGMAMSIVGQTAPLSGWEHVISHFLDITAPGDGRSTALHGAQVGLATVISARAYESSWKQACGEQLLAPDDLDRQRKLLTQVFQAYDSDGTMLAELWRDYSRKLERWSAREKQRMDFFSRLESGAYDKNLKRFVRPARVVEEALRESGSPMRFGDLDRPIPATSAEAAVGYAHLVRSRFTFGDLLGFECLQDLSSDWLSNLV